MSGDVPDGLTVGPSTVSFRPVPADAEVCAASGCEWTTGGTASGCPPMRCWGYGGPAGCAADWLSVDPEDREPYAEYLAGQPQDRSPERTARIEAASVRVQPQRRSRRQRRGKR